MGIILSNNAASTLASSISDASATLTVAAGEGALFPLPAGGDYFYCTLLDANGVMEIVKVTARTGDVFSIVRAQESTVARSFAASSKIELRVTAASIQDAVDTAVGGITLADFGVTATSAEINKLTGLTASSIELNVLDGIVATTAELNIMSGVTASNSDINKLVGLTASTSELNTLTGVTATVSDLNKLSGVTASAAELNKLSGVTATTAELNKLAGLTATTSELNKMSGVTVTTTEINRLAGVTSNIQTQINSFASFPPGAIIAYAGSVAPTGWVLCQGQQLSRTTYSALFAVVGTTYGAGNGSTTFNIPDLRGRVAAGKDDMGGVAANRLTGTSGSVAGAVLGATGGTETHVLSIAEMPAHTHNILWQYQSPSSGSGDVASYLGSTGSTSATQSTGSGGAHNNVQPTIILSYIIKT